jgi:hypothetical protein
MSIKKGNHCWDNVVFDFEEKEVKDMISMSIKKGNHCWDNVVFDFEEKEVKDNGNTEKKEDACPSMREVREESDNSCRQCFFYLQGVCNQNPERREQSRKA